MSRERDNQAIIDRIKGVPAKADDGTQPGNPMEGGMSEPTTDLEKRALNNKIRELNARMAELKEALRIIAGEQQCADNLMSDKDIARAVLAHDGHCAKE